MATLWVWHVFSRQMLPPSISQLAQLGRLASVLPQAHPQRFQKMAAFYRAVAKGNAAPLKPSGPLQRYYQHYIAKDSFAPVLHFLAIMVPTGYYVAYFKGGHYHPRFQFH